MNYITSWCRIRQNAVTANGQTVFEDRASGLPDFLTNTYRYLQIDYPKFYKMDRLCQLGFLAAEVMLRGRALKEEYPPESVAVVLANRHSSLDTDVRYQESMSGIPSPALFVYTLPNIVIGEICIRHQIKGENTFFVQEQFDIPFLNDYTGQLLEQGAALAVIGGWVDVFQDQYEAFLYLAGQKQTPGSVIHNRQNVSALYGIVDAGS